MKQIISTLSLAALLLSVSACRRQAASSSSDVRRAQLADICLRDTLHDFGTIPLSQAIDSFDFTFTNCGKERLVVLGVKTSCHCIQVSYPHTPVEPGKESFIRVIYDGRGRHAEYFDKSVRITTNAKKETVTLEIRGRVQ